MRSFLGRACCMLLAVAATGQDLQTLYKDQRWPELYAATARATKGDELYRGALGVVFHQQPGRTEALLRSVIANRAGSEQAYEAHEWLIHLYLYLGKYAQLEAISKQRWARFPDKQERAQEEAALTVLRGLPDQVTLSITPSTVSHEENSLFIPLMVNGTSARYFFDTGAWSSCLSESEAKRLGLTVRDAEGTVATMTDRIGLRTAVAKEVVVGGLRLKDVSFYVFPDSGEPWSVLPEGRRGLMGIPVIVAMKTLTWSHDGSLRLGGKEEPLHVEDANLLFDNDHLAVKAEWEGQPIWAAMDTGAQSTDMYDALVSQFPKLASTGKKESIEVRGVGGTRSYEAVAWPELRFTLGGAAVMLKPAHALMGQGVRSYVGNFGTDLLQQGRSFHFDFSAMKLVVEPR